MTIGRLFQRGIAHLAVLVICVPAAASAQSSAGTLKGLVQDTSGAVLPGVTITATHKSTALAQETVSGASGEWTIAALPVGVYELDFKLEGFKHLVRSDVNVEAAVPRSVNVSLEVGGLSEQVNVSADAELLTPTTATTFRKIDAEQLTEVPTSTRSFTHLLSSEAGVSSDLPPSMINGTGNISPSVNGTRTTSTSLFFNGIDATNLTSNEGSMSDNISPAPEMLDEVKLQTSMYDASTGRSGGGNFQLVTRSGSNQYSGSLFSNFQHETFAANDFFYRRDGIEKPKARRNEGGLTLGGPIFRDRFFFFGGYQKTKAETGFVPTASSITVLPAALGLIDGARTKENVWAAFSALNPGILASIPKAQCASPTDSACISDVAIALLNMRNPVTGDFVIPAPRAGLPTVGTDIVAGPSVGGNPFVRQRNVSPAEFEQDQFTLKLDGRVSDANRVSGSAFYADFPGFDPYPDPNSLASPFTLRRADKNSTYSLSDTHVFSGNLVNEMRGGVFNLNNSRRLDDPFLGLTNDSIGISNPATFFDTSDATLRLGHYVGAPGTLMERFSFGGPNDTFNKRRQRTYTWGNTLTWTRQSHALRVGGEFRRNEFDTNLPEEQATEFEKFENFTMILRGLAREGDTQFGITNKQFRFNDFNAFIVDDWHVSRSLTLNLGLRYEFFGLPTELNGRMGNFDPSLVTDPENPSSGFIVPKSSDTTGFAAVDGALAATTHASTNHTLKGQDWNNVAPRVGFAWTPGGASKTVIRGGYGMFFDRPSAAFINTVFSNYPFLREVEVTFPNRAVPMTTAFSRQDPSYPFNGYLPNRVVRTAGANGTYEIRDGTPVTTGADGSLNPIDPATGLPTKGNVAETFEFRAIDRNLKTPYVQQYNLGFQRELTGNSYVEVRYVGSRGQKLLEARALNLGYDLNAADTPDHIFERFNKAYLAAGSPNGPLNAGSTAKERGVGRAFGFANATRGDALDYNLANASGGVISFEARGPMLGFDIPEAIMLGNTGHSTYNSAQFNFVRRMSRGLGYNLSYTYSRSKDTSSVDPGSTAGGGKPDLPNAGFTVQGNSRDLEANFALSDFDRPHRFSGSFVYELPGHGILSGFRVAGFAQWQSGRPYSIFAAEQVVATTAQYNDLRIGSGGLYRLAFGRPSLCGTLDELRQPGADEVAEAFNKSVLCSPMTAAGGYPNNQGFGNLGRNVLRGNSQRRVDVSLAKVFALGSKSLEAKWDVFNVFNTINFGTPNNVIGDATTDFGSITDTVGGPRVMQFGLKFRY